MLAPNLQSKKKKKKNKQQINPNSGYLNDSTIDLAIMANAGRTTI